MSPRFIAGATAPPAGAYDADVVILSLDRPAETIEAIESALAQTDVQRHVLILDQGSRPENLARVAAAVEGRPDATLLACEENLGVPGGRNAASAFGHGRIIAGLDNDAAFATVGSLARAVMALDAEPGLAAIGFRILIDTTGEDDLSSWGYPSRLLPRAAEAFDATTFVGAGHAIRRAAWDDVGGYDASLFFCWEEFDFCLRAIERGWRIRYRGDIAVRHKVSSEQRIAWPAARWSRFVRNRLYVARKYGEAWPGIALRAAGYLVKGARNGLLQQTLQGLHAGLTATVPRQVLSWPAREYLAWHDTAHRGSLVRRIRREVLAALPGGT
jgi:GT2 family glycosyltransferase